MFCSDARWSFDNPAEPNPGSSTTSRDVHEDKRGIEPLSTGAIIWLMTEFQITPGTTDVRHFNKQISTILNADVTPKDNLSNGFMSRFG